MKIGIFQINTYIKILLNFLLILSSMAVFFNCSSKQEKYSTLSNKTFDNAKPNLSPSTSLKPNISTPTILNPPISSHKNDEINTVKNVILKEFEKWEGTPHKMGGNSKRGIDCSGFAHYFYKKLFNLTVPLTTRQFFTTGIKINKAQLKPGDLVAFRPLSYPRHVGIYIGNNKFIHASTTKGVMMSDLNNPYWIKHYVMSRRIMQN